MQGVEAIGVVNVGVRILRLRVDGLVRGREVGGLEVGVGSVRERRGAGVRGLPHSPQLGQPRRPVAGAVVTVLGRQGGRKQEERDKDVIQLRADTRAGQLHPHPPTPSCQASPLPRTAGPGRLCRQITPNPKGPDPGALLPTPCSDTARGDGAVPKIAPVKPESESNPEAALKYIYIIIMQNQAVLILPPPTWISPALNATKPILWFSLSPGHLSKTRGKAKPTAILWLFLTLKHVEIASRKPIISSTSFFPPSLRTRSDAKTLYQGGWVLERGGCKSEGGAAKRCRVQKKN